MEAVFATWYLRTIFCDALEPENPKSTCSKNCTPFGQFLLFRSRVTAQDALSTDVLFRVRSLSSAVGQGSPVASSEIRGVGRSPSSRNDIIALDP